MNRNNLNALKLIHKCMHNGMNMRQQLFSFPTSLPVFMFVHTRVCTNLPGLCKCVCVFVCMWAQTYQSKKVFLLGNHRHLPPSKISHNDSYAQSNMNKGGKSTKYTLKPFTIFELLSGGSKCNLHNNESRFKTLVNYLNTKTRTLVTLSSSSPTGKNINMIYAVGQLFDHEGSQDRTLPRIWGRSLLQTYSVLDYWICMQ